MTHTRSIVVSGVLVLACCALAACGKSGPSRADFAKRADALCTQANRSAPRTAPKTAKEAIRFTQLQLAGRSALDAKLRRLSAPASERSTFAAYNSATATMLGILRRQNAAARHNDESTYDRLQYRFSTTAVQRAKLATKLGFRVCGGGTPRVEK